MTESISFPDGFITQDEFALAQRPAAPPRPPEPFWREEEVVHLPPPLPPERQPPQPASDDMPEGARGAQIYNAIPNRHLATEAQRAQWRAAAQSLHPGLTPLEEELFGRTPREAAPRAPEPLPPPERGAPPPELSSTAVVDTVFREFHERAPDYSQLPASIDAVIARELFSYADVPGMTGGGESDNPRSIVYAEELAAIYSEMGGPEMLEMARTFAHATEVTLQAVGIKPSDFAKSPTWSLWDMAKQRHQVTQSTRDRGALDPSYDTRTLRNGAVVPNIADPTQHTPDAINKRWDIIDRHVGWETIRAYYESPDRSLGILSSQTDPMYAREILDIIQHGDTNDGFEDPNQRVAKLRSRELSRIGELVRLAAQDNDVTSYSHRVEWARDDLPEAYRKVAA